MNIIYTPNDPTLPLRDTSVALGMFDGMHVGHQSVVRKAVSEAEKYDLKPCVFTFALARETPGFKNGATLLADTDTLSHLIMRMGVAAVYAPDFSQVRAMDAEQFVVQILRDLLGAKVLCCGVNFTFSRNGGAHVEDLQQLARQNGMEVHILPMLELDGDAVSSTRIRSLISNGQIPQANRLLGRRFSINFPVVHGNRIGRTLGTPTINQPFPSGFTIPRYGVYATIARVGDKTYSGVTNVGVKPTIGKYDPLAETFILGFSGDLYGQRVEVEFLEFVRPEQKFDSIEALRERIFADARTAAEIAEPFL